nr:MAG: ORF1 [Torque teno midi virus]
MPFFWRRRNRYWGPRHFRRRFKRRWSTRRRPLRRRRRHRRTLRRRKRRRRTKVRRKKKTITIKQWQPDSIRKCKIKGMGVLVLGAEGKQFVCYTNVRQSSTPSQAPGGGGFGCMQFSLGYLYEEYKFRNNIWTHTNINYDLCRYIHCRLTLYRHPETDFIIRYDRQPPFNIEPLTYIMCHPQNMLLAKHKIILLSKSSKPNGKLKKKVIIKPPKQMITKWFFQEHFSTAGLFQLSAAAANLQYSHIGCCNKNQMNTFFCLNLSFYQQGNWAAHHGTVPYKPYPTCPTTLWYWDADNYTKDQMADTTFRAKHGFQVKADTYEDSVSYDTGFFNTKVLTAKMVTTDKDPASHTGTLPVVVCRYNINKDTGKGNTIWLHSNLTTSYDKPTTDKTIIIQGMPIWMMLYGWPSYVQHVKNVPDFFLSYSLLMQSPAIEYASQPGQTPIVFPLDQTFVNGKPPYGQPLTYNDKIRWYPDIYNQLEIINNIVTTGPYVPKYSNTRNSTWELQYSYNFLFKWGGPEQTDQPIADPSSQPVYDALDKQSATIQIRNPANQKFETLLHPWDSRRGIIKKTALKRIYDNLSIDTDMQPDDFTPKKRKITGPCLTAPETQDQEIKSCLHSLCEESTWQEAQEEKSLLQLIQQQREQQQQLKYNILKVISEMKEQQNLLKLQTGWY